MLRGLKQMDDSSVANAFKRMQIPLLILAPDGEILHCNDASNCLFGLNSGNLLGRSVCDFLPVSSLAELNAYIKPPAIDANIMGMIGRKKNGDPIVLGIYITAWSDPQQGLQHILYLRDVEQELNAERLKSEELARVSSAVKGARIGVIEFNAITKTLFFSDIAKQLLEIDALTSDEMRSQWHERVHPDDRETAERGHHPCLEGRQERSIYEYRMRSKVGPAWRWIRVDISVAEKDRSGKAIRLISAITDISERKATANALRVNADQFRSAFQNSTTGRAIVGLDGCCLRVNSALCNLFGYPEAEMLKMGFQTLTHPDDLEADLIQIDRLVRGEIKSYRMEKRYIRANGAIMWGLLNVDIVSNADGDPEHFLSHVVDLTEQRRLNQLKESFVATVSHELRTPLTSILGALTMLDSIKDEFPSDQAQRLLFIGKKNADQLNLLINDILDFEKFTAGEMRFILSKQRIAGLVDESLLSNLAMADKFGVHLNGKYTDRDLHGLVDPKRFQQIMANLLSNAAKFAEKGSTIDVDVERQADTIKVSVSNTGSAIPDSFQDHIFEPFAQAAAVSTRNRGGSGLGLSITKRMVEQMGGEIGFTSAEDCGTVFWFTIPVNDQKLSSERIADPQTP